MFGDHAGRAASAKDTLMGEFTDKAKAAANTITGSVKEGVGEATGNERLEAEGEAQKLRGDVQKVTGDVKGAMGNKI